MMSAIRTRRYSHNAEAADTPPTYHFKLRFRCPCTQCSVSSSYFSQLRMRHPTRCIFCVAQVSARSFECCPSLLCAPVPPHSFILSLVICYLLTPFSHILLDPHGGNVLTTCFRSNLPRPAVQRQIKRSGPMTTSRPSNRTVAFHHEPLDHSRSSIRLIRIEPGLSARGLVRCKISHQTIETKYTCLSYRWGDDDRSTSRTILLNEESFIVRQNLYDFLHLACTEPRWSDVTQRNYWIDALCINQSDCSERNHQVAQMGHTFASARRVHVWLGKTSEVRCVPKLLSRHSSESSMHSESFGLQGNMQLVGRYILYNEYWNRAWVIQEIVIACSVIVSLDMTTLRLSECSNRFLRLGLDISQTPFEQFIGRGTQSLRALVSDRSLLFLLHWFRDKHCSVPYDRVFALLAVCQEADRLEVDYDMHWTDLALHVLGNHRHELCVCSAALVTRSLIFNPSKPRTGNRTCIRRPMLAFDGRYIHIDSYANPKLLYPDIYARPPAWPQRHRCLRSLVQAFHFGWTLCRLGSFMFDEHRIL